MSCHEAATVERRQTTLAACFGNTNSRQQLPQRAAKRQLKSKTKNRIDPMTGQFTLTTNSGGD